MNLHSDKEAFKEIIALAAEHFGYEQSHVEKDYWVSKILRDISMSEYPLYVPHWESASLFSFQPRTVK